MLDRFRKRITLPTQLQRPWLVAKVIYQDVDRADVFKHASAMAYVTLFSLVPSIAAIFSIVSMFSQFWSGAAGLMDKVKDFILANLAQGSGEQALQYLDGFIANLDIAKIGTTGLAGILVTLVLLLRNIERALNVIFHVSKERTMLSRVVNFWLFLTMGTFVAAISLGVLSGFDLSNLNPFENSELQQGFLEWVIPKLSIWMFFGLLYKVTPNTFVPAKSAAIGAIVSATLFTVASNFYGVFATKFTSYQAVYGALAAIPLFLMWLYLIWVIILVGGVVTSRSMVGFDLEQTEKDLQVVASSSLEKHRDHQLQESLPLVLLLLIYKEFAKAIGHGLSLNNLRKSSHLPESWLIEGLDILEQMGFIVKTSKVVDDFSGESVEYFPAFPSESLLIKDVIHKFRSEAAAWLQRWHEQLGINHQSIIDVYWRRKSDLAEATTMRDLVNAGTG